MLLYERRGCDMLSALAEPLAVLSLTVPILLFINARFTPSAFTKVVPSP